MLIRTFESAFSRLRIWSKAFYIGLTLSVLLQFLAIFGPLQGLLGLTTVNIGDLLMTSTVSFMVIILVVEIHKLFGRRLIRVQD